MKQSVLSRPNLKVLALGAILLAAITQLVSNGSSEPATGMQARARAHDGATDKYLSALLAQAANTPDPEVYNKISLVYERKGDYRKALFFLRQADRLTELADN